MAVNTPAFKLKSGDDRVIRLEIKAPNGEDPQPLTGVSAINFALAASLAGPALIEKALGVGIDIVGDPALGIVDVTFFPYDTAELAGRFVWEFQIIDGFGFTSTVFFPDASGVGLTNATVNGVFYNSAVIEQDLIV